MEIGNKSASATCEWILESFKFPVLEVLVIIQIFLPVVYSFIIPCIAACTLETVCSYRPETTRIAWRKKLTNLLLESWFHWYMHWEIWSWFWCLTGLYYSLYCSLPPRYYEYSFGIGTASILVSLISNLLSDFRNYIPDGSMKYLFVISCFLMSSWILRIIYTCCFEIVSLSILRERENSVSEISSIRHDPPPDYSDVRDNEAPPPSYEETLSRIRRQLPKLQRSISLTAQRLGRSMSIIGKKTDHYKSYSTTRRKEIEREDSNKS